MGEDLACLLSCKVPGEVVMEILSKLPVNSLMRFKCVSKSWSRLMKNQIFIAMHFNHFSKINNDCFLLSTFNDYLASTELSLYNPKTQKSKRIGSRPGIVELVGSANGILCIVVIQPDFGFGNCFELLNPSIMECITVSRYADASEVVNRGPSYISVGFGYDPRSRDCKLVRIQNFGNSREKGNTEVDIYSNNAHCWNTINAEIRGLLKEHISSACVNNKLHWFGTSNDIHNTEIITFDLETEVFGRLRLHPSLFFNKCFIHDWKQDKLAVIRYLYDDPNNWGFEVWILNNYGDNNSWCRERNYIPDTELYMGLSGRNGDYLVYNWDDSLLHYCVEDEGKLLRSKGVLGDHWYQALQVMNFKESLTMIDSKTIPSSALNDDKCFNASFMFSLHVAIFTIFLLNPI